METVSKLDQATLEQILLFVIGENPETKVEFDAARRAICGKLRVEQPPNRFLLPVYQKAVKEGKATHSDLIFSLLTKADVRNLSGIAVVTSLIKPYTCPGKCIYCPTEYRMPKSYIATEPAAARALRLDFSPYEQMKQRIEMLERNGHNCDKIEFILKGGTWNAYPLLYQYWFVLESFRAANNFSRETPTAQTKEEDWKKIEDIQKAIDEEQTFNEGAKHRIIGLTLETRPDAIVPKTIMHMRRQGCTRIELGLQATDDNILALVERGHTVEQFRKAILLLRDAGFKVDLHMMPDLPGTTPDHDIEMYQALFSDPGLRPDMVKIYPCAVVKTAELYQWLQDGRYTPYGEEGLFRALLEMKKSTPRYCRISRLIRDIPASEIEAGNKITNLREELEKELHARGEKCVCLRCREIGRQRDNIPEDTEPQLFVDTYETIGGTEYFLSFEDSERIAVFGFLRLRIPHSHSEESSGGTLYKLIPELQGCAFVRELHVYGDLIKIGEHKEAQSQHKGYGKRLMAAAEKIARENAFNKVAVISGVGVRKYYEKLGYVKDGTYMVKKIEN